MLEYPPLHKNLFSLENSKNSICFSATGKMMIMGEHAVLYGQPCIILSVDQRIKATLTPSDNDQIILNSDVFKTYKTDLQSVLNVNIHDLPQDWLFVLVACKKMLSATKSGGFTLDVQSDFSPTVGLGSSAAVTVATVACLLSHTRSKNVTTETLFNTCYDIVYTAQGKKGSGADLLASILGGITYYHPKRKILNIKKSDFAFSAIYAGYKTRTPEVIEHIAQATSDWKTSKIDALYAQMGALSDKAWRVIETADSKTLGQLMTANHVLLQKLGASDETLDHIVTELNAQKAILGAKLSGAGLGDCVIALGQAENIDVYERINIPTAKEGLRRETP